MQRVVLIFCVLVIVFLLMMGSFVAATAQGGSPRGWLFPTPTCLEAICLLKIQPSYCPPPPPVTMELLCRQFTPSPLISRPPVQNDTE